MKKETTMKIEALAKWNDTKGVWEVFITEYETKENLLGNFIETKREYSCEMGVCDELVIPQALLQMNGLKL